MRLTMHDIEQKQKEGKIRGYRIVNAKKIELKEPNGKIVSRHYTQRSKEKDFIAWCLWDFAQRKGVVLYQEYRFCEERKFRFDFCIPDLMLAFEYNGIFSDKSRHTTVGGYSTDRDKINLAQTNGWTVLEFTPINYKTLPQALKKYE